MLWSIVIHRSQKTLIWQISSFPKSHRDIFIKVQTMTTIMILFELKLYKLSFFAGRSWSRCASGGCQEEQGGQKRRLIFIFVFFVDLYVCILFCFLVDLCICICRFPYKTVLSSGGELGSEQEGEERRGGHLPCLPWGLGRGRAGWKWFKLAKINLLPCQVGTVACPCQQPHHRACLTKWLRGHDTCPYCRGSVNTK